MKINIVPNVSQLVRKIVIFLLDEPRKISAQHCTYKRDIIWTQYAKKCQYPILRWYLLQETASVALVWLHIGIYYCRSISSEIYAAFVTFCKNSSQELCVFYIFMFSLAYAEMSKENMHSKSNSKIN